MPWPKVALLGVTSRQREELEGLCRARTTPHAVVTRARIVCAAADGASTSRIARRWGLSRNTVQLWRERWGAATESLLGAEAAEAATDSVRGPALAAAVRRVLADAPRPGAPSTFTPEQLCQVVAVACESPPDSDRPTSHWTPREIADEVVKRGIVARISVRTVGRFLVAGASGVAGVAGVAGSGRAQAPPDSFLAHATRRRSRAVRRRGAHHL